MKILGPYVVFEDKTPSEWCYFDFDDANQAVCYTSIYPSTRAKVDWTQKTLTDKTPLYVYDPKTG